MTALPARVAAAVLAALLVTGSGVAAAAADPYRSSQWGLERIGAPAAWASARGQGQVIAVVDSGVDLDHPDLAERLLRDADGRVVGRDYVDGDGVPQDANGHGTMVAGIAAAATDNGEGISGVAPRARIMPVRVLDDRGRGSAADVDAAIRWAVDNGATVVNLSLESVSPLPGGLLTQAPVAAVRYAWEQGVVVVAAAGNSGAAFTDYPDSSPVLLVGATDRDDRRAGFSDSGRRDAVLAPGVGIVSTWCDPSPEGCHPDHRYGEADGTSFASPAVAGAVAILRSSGLSAEAAVQRLRDTSVDIGPPGPDADNGHGRIDVAAAVGTVTGSSATSPSPSDPDAAASPPADEDRPVRDDGGDASHDAPGGDDGGDQPEPARTAAPEPSRPAAGDAGGEPVSPDSPAGSDIVPHDGSPQAAQDLTAGRRRGAGEPRGVHLAAALLVAITGGAVGSLWWQDRQDRRGRSRR